MFSFVETTNFRKLDNHTFDFVAGLNAIRALNERGKSTLLESMAYAMFGTDALREPLADVVTWGEKESSLKVKLRLNINSNQVEIRRGKSGAEIDVDGKLVATGQKEVTRFVEGLLGAAPKVAAKLMLANQASLRGALSEGPTATAQLIEQLSNFALIDEVIQLVQERLPCGAPAPLEQQVKTLSSQVAEAEPGELDLSAHEADLASHQTALAIQARGLAEIQAELPAAKAAADAGRAQARALQAAQARATGAEEAITRTETALSRLNLACSVTAEELERLRGWVKATNSAQDAQAAHRALTSLKPADQEWEGLRESFDEAVAANQAAARTLAATLTDLEVTRAKVSGWLIKEQACAFCGKDLKDVPEVALLNSELGKELASLRYRYDTLAAQRAELNEEQHAYASIAHADRAARDVYAKHHVYLEMVEGTVPPKLTWIGPDLNQAVQGGALQALRAAEAEVLRAAQDKGKHDSLSNELARLKVELLQVEVVVKDLTPKVKADRSSGLESDILERIKRYEIKLAEARSSVREAEQAIANARQIHGLKVQAHARAKKLLAEAHEQLEQLQLNNVLLKKLRSARPKVADKLWGTVLATVSYYFSAIRGVQSVVTRDDSGFRVDGKPVPGLSGSTLDALGLAIRIALTKTFLPNNDFMILDEPAAACDDERESNMLGVITTAGFDQVLLVTHSALADAFAEKVISL